MFRPTLVLLSVAALLLTGYLLYQPVHLQQLSNTATPIPTLQPAIAIPSATPTARKSVARRASFLIFTNGLKRDFSDPKYHNRSQDIYVRSDNPAVVNITKAGITWGQFFDTLPMKLSKDCLTTGTGQVFCSGSDGTLSFYLRGVKASNALDLEIFDGDGLLVTYGNLTDEQIKQQLDQVPDPYIPQKR